MTSDIARASKRRAVATGLARMEQRGLALVPAGRRWVFATATPPPERLTNETPFVQAGNVLGALGHWPTPTAALEALGAMPT